MKGGTQILYIAIVNFFYFEGKVVYIHYHKMNGTMNSGFTIYVADFMHPCLFCHVFNYKHDLSSEMHGQCP